MNGIYIAHRQGDENNNNYLMHYGVKGMKWGRHKARSREGYDYNSEIMRARRLGGTHLNGANEAIPGKLKSVSGYKNRDIKVGSHKIANVTSYTATYGGRDHANRMGYVTNRKRVNVTVNPNIKKKAKSLASRAKSASSKTIARGKNAASRILSKVSKKKQTPKYQKYHRTTFN